MQRIQHLVVVVVVVVAGAAAGCAPLAVQQDPPGSMAGLDDEVSFLGAYDARVALGGVQTLKTVTTMGATPVYGAGGYAGTVYYPQQTTVRTGEIAPNDALRLVAEGFRAASDGAKVKDLSGTTPLEVRTEMGMDWFAKNNPALSNHLVSIEIKSASVALDDAALNYRLGITAIALGVLSPCVLCTTAPCFAYPLLASTKASSEAQGTLRVYDKKLGHVVHREELNVEVKLDVKGFHDSEQVFALLSAETGKRLGYQAARKLRDHLRGPTTTTSAEVATPDDDAPPPPKQTPSLDRPAGSPPPPPGDLPKQRKP